ncbi:EpsG family protein [Phocaeicola sartorii]|uniref:EpsG family protein n=1 Tax=Phocaeicola sartorii TaxID=671267 RepID=UPI00258DAB16|nr:EpsG family protein [Phocaeicola sartorii]
MIPYLVLFILFCFVFFIAYIRYIEISKALLFNFIILALFIGLRDQVGADWPGYKLAFDQKYEYFEIGYTLVAKFFRHLGCSFNWFLMFMSFITVAPIFLFFRKYQDSICIIPSFFVISFMGLIAISSIIRQAFAMSVFLYSWIYLEKKDLTRYALCIILASLFHKSALILILLYPIGYLTLKNKMYWYLYGGALLLGVVKFPIDKIIAVLPLELGDYSGYFDSVYAVSREFGFVVFGRLSLYFVVLVLSLQYSTVKKELLFKMFVLGAVFYNLSLSSTFFSRFENYFIYSAYFYIPILLTHLRFGKDIIFIFRYVIYASWLILIMAKLFNPINKMIPYNMFLL